MRALLQRQKVSAEEIEVANAIQRQLGVSDRDALKLTRVLNREIATRIDNGELISFVRPMPDGTSQLTVLGLEMLRNRSRGG